MAIQSHNQYTQEIADALQYTNAEGIKYFTGYIAPDEVIDEIQEVIRKELQKTRISDSSYAIVAELLVPYSPLSLYPLIDFLYKTEMFGYFSGAAGTPSGSDAEFRQFLNASLNEYIDDGLRTIYDNVSNNMPGFLQDLIEQQDQTFANNLSLLLGVPVSKGLASVVAGILLGTIPRVEISDDGGFVSVP
jgi:hypothetical protein